MLASKILPSLLFGATTVLADGQAIVNAIAAVSNATLSLQSTVGNWNGDLLGAIPIIAKSTSLLTAIKQGTSTAEDSAALSDLEAISVGVSTLNLVTTVNSTLDTIVGAKPQFDRLLLSPVTLLNLELEKSASADFSGAIVGKLPATFTTTGQQLAAQIDAAFEEAIDVYDGPF